jgi:hypothetical protein
MSAAGLLVVVAQLCASLGKSLRVIGVEFGGRGGSFWGVFVVEN